MSPPDLLIVGLALNLSVFRAGLCAVLDGAAEVQVVTLPAGAPDPEAAGPCDVLVLEVPSASWVEALDQLDQAGVPPRKVLAVCAVGTGAEAAEMLALGVAGCLSPEDQPEAALARVRAVARGDYSASRRELLRLFDPLSHCSTLNIDGSASRR